MTIGGRLVWLDLCSGLGGASQPAVDRGWKVIRVDIDRRFKPDIVADVRSLPLRPFHVDVLWASPPCEEFSKWAMSASWACNKGVKRHPVLSLVNALPLIADYFKPDYWIIENVWAARPWLTGLFGPLRAKCDGHAFYGRLPCLLPDTKGHKWKLPPSPDRGALRAKIPYEIGEAICIAVERRAGLFHAQQHDRGSPANDSK